MKSDEERNDDNNNGGEEVDVSPGGTSVPRLATKPVSDLASTILYPCQFVENYRKDREIMENTIELLNHMTKFGTQGYWDKTKVHTSIYLDIAVSTEQERLFNPIPVDYIAGYIISQSIGPAATKKLSHCWLNIIDGSIKSYAKILNSKER
eukprot:11632993-Ditylum_brightwellii.AAC.1